MSSKYVSKCTCAHRHPSQHVRAWNFTHAPECYYAKKLEEERQARADRDTIQRLYKYYRTLPLSEKQ